MMNAEYESLLKSFQAKFENLISLYLSEKEKNSKLLQEIEQYKLSLSYNKNELEKINKKYANLSLAKAMLDEDGEGSKEAKQRLNKIIREIDQCIALLNK
ncbi:MAG: hypothetical protein GX879_04140 [Bacteroidales bacterium]|nr:hypothetical protein [Bacteroidales bacterium]